MNTLNAKPFIRLLNYKNAIMSISIYTNRISNSLPLPEGGGGWGERPQSNIQEKQNIDLSEPRRFKVIIYNDDFTTMDFVVKVLREVFFKQGPEAEQLMMTVHRTGQAVVGVYTYDIARSKVRKATDMARAAGFPLRLAYKPE